jgi:hypothetical protein
MGAGNRSGLRDLGWSIREGPTQDRQATAVHTATGTGCVTGFHDNQDNRGVWVETWVLDLVEGDHAAAVLLAQLLWWHQPGKNGRSRVAYERGGDRWLLRSDDEWEAECRLTTLQVRRIRRFLVDRDLVVCARFKRGGAPTSAWRPNYERLNVPEVEDSPTSPEGQLGSGPGGQLGSGPGGQVPIPSPERSTTSSKNQLSDFDRFWAAYPLRLDRKNAEKAWAKALGKLNVDPEILIAAAAAYRDDPNRDDGFTKHPPTWLNGECWTNGPLPPRLPTNSNGHRSNGKITTDRSGESGRVYI